MKGCAELPNQLPCTAYQLLQLLLLVVICAAFAAVPQLLNLQTMTTAQRQHCIRPWQSFASIGNVFINHVPAMLVSVHWQLQGKSVPAAAAQTAPAALPALLLW